MEPHPAALPLRGRNRPLFVGPTALSKWKLALPGNFHFDFFCFSMLSPIALRKPSTMNGLPYIVVGARFVSAGTIAIKR
jgi:hypothetical protein